MPGGATEIVIPSARFGPLQSRLAKGTQRFESAVLIDISLRWTEHRTSRIRHESEQRVMHVLIEEYSKNIS